MGIILFILYITKRLPYVLDVDISLRGVKSEYLDKSSPLQSSRFINCKYILMIQRLNGKASGDAYNIVPMFVYLFVRVLFLFWFVMIHFIISCDELLEV